MLLIIYFIFIFTFWKFFLLVFNANIAVKGICVVSILGWLCMQSLIKTLFLGLLSQLSGSGNWYIINE
uniref:Uncharacterized protein n=1 Tax=Rhizophora mucronata TaxID=61149 RepID=A0A2P2LFW6_RHIMU